MPSSLVMKKFRARKLHSGSKTGRLVKNPQQAKKIEERIAALEKGGPDAAKAAANLDELALDDDLIVRQAYLRTLNRLPTADEQDRCVNYLAEAESPLAGAKGLLWTLLNTKEFIVNH